MKARKWMSGTKVQFCLLLFVLIPVKTSARQILDLSNGAFSRDSNAYFSEGNTMETYPAGVARTTTVLSCSASDGNMIYGEGPAGENISPCCSNSKGLYGVNQSNPSGDFRSLYLSEDGLTWRKIYQSPYRIMSMFSAANDMLIAWMNTSTYSYTAYYSADCGLTWQPCVNADGGDVVFPGGYPYPWNFNQRPPKEGEPYGTIISSTYNGPSYPHQIWRSTDNGVTWKKVLELEPYYISHFHAIGYHVALDKWVADTGDNSNPDWPYNTRQHTFVSDDDGQTWHEYAYNIDGTGKRSNTGQVIRYRDYGHPTRMLFASDSARRISWVDLVTWETGTLMKNPPLNQDSTVANYFYDVFKYDNIWYACLWSYGGVYHSSAIYVSPDLEHWAIYHKFDIDSGVQGGNQFAGFVGDKLHIRTSTDTLSVLGHFSVSPAKVALVNDAIVVTPSKTNLMTSSQSRCETTSGWSDNIFGFSPSLSYDVNFAGNASIYCNIVFFPGGQLYLYGPTTNVTPGQTYLPHFWVRGNVLTVEAGFTDMNKTLLSQAAFGTRGNEGWTDVWGYPYTVPQNITSLRLLCIYHSNQIDGLINEWLGATEIAQSPNSPWHEGQIASSPEHIDHSVILSNNFTHLFSAEFKPSTNGMGDDFVYLCTYYISPTDYVKLYYDPDMERFCLESITSNPEQGGVIYSRSQQWLHRHATVKIAVRYLNGSLKLSVADGDSIEHVGVVLTRHGVPLQGLSRIIRTGDANGLAVMPYALYDSMLYNRALSDEEVNSVFNAARISDVNLPDVSAVFAPEAFIDSISPNPAIFGRTITFTGHGTDVDGSIVAYSWDSNIDGHLNDANSFSTTILSSGHHIISFAVTDSNGLVSQAVTQEVDVNGPFAPEAFIDSILPDRASFGTMITITGHGTDIDGSIVGYSWSSNIDSYLSDANSFSTTQLSAGNHIITFTVTDNNGLTSPGVTQQVIINPPCSSRFNLDADPSGYIDFNDLFIFTANWLSEGADIVVDFNNDEKVDLLDFNLLSGYWGFFCDAP